MNLRLKFGLILVLAVVAAILAYPRETDILKKVGINTTLGVRRGLDLQGGAELVYEADLSKLTSATDRTNALNGVVDVVQRRLNPAGTSEIVVQQAAGNRIIVELPGVKDLSQAISLIGQTAQLSFYDVTASGQQTLSDLSGKDFASASTDIDPQSGQPVIHFSFKSDAVSKFAALTTHINSTGDRLAIVLDNQVLFNGMVSTPITDGTGVMQGFSSIDEAKKTTVLLNAGALPVPINLVEQQTVGATLGAESIAKSFVAGIIGLLVVLLFMAFYYRGAGLLADAALIIYALVTVSLYKISTLTPWTIVLTLAGIAGFILSIGMAVDANILIFERTREEVRAGKGFAAAVEAGFDRAWTSIRDSNISTLITCLILYYFGAPIIKGFAVTLGLGVVVSLFTAVVVSRTFLRLAMRTKIGQRPEFYGLSSREEL